MTGMIFTEALPPSLPLPFLVKTAMTLALGVAVQVFVAVT